jgi:hypothetical protein
MRAMRRLAIPALTALVGAALLATVPAVTLGADPCRVRNVDQGTKGGSLKAMAAAANDGDTLRVRGVCRGEVIVGDDITIRGVGDAPAVTGQDARRVFRIKASADVTIRDLVIRNGRAPNVSGLRGGGGIRNRGEVTLTQVVVRHNHSGGGGVGGGILNFSDLVIRGSTIRGNRASLGGAIDNRTLEGHPSAAMTIEDSRLIRNSAVDVGGAIENFAVAHLIDTTVARNRAGFGGGIANVAPGAMEIDTSTIRRNRAVTQGGGIANFDAGATVSLDGASVVADNVPDNCVDVPGC